MKRPHKSRRGFVLIAVTISIFTLIGMTGLAVDLGRMYVAKSEAQAFCDSAALAAAVKLDGKTTGIVAAKNAVSQAYGGLHWNWGSDKITSPQVDFSTGLAGPWSTNPASPSGYSYARVKTSTSVPPYFMAVLNVKPGDVAAGAVAAQVAITKFDQGMAPYTAVVQDATKPDFGFIEGKEYDLQWPQYNSTRNGCGPNNPKKCFNADPCKDESTAAELAAVDYWGSSTNGYWGSNKASEIAAEVLDLVQSQPISIGDLITMASGNMNTQAKILDDRVNQDIDLIHNTTTPGYLTNPNNGRRLIGVPIVKPSANGTRVVGFASFLLESNGAPKSDFYAKGNGNDPFCGIYVGSYVVGGSSGGATSSGAFRVALVR